MMEMVHHTNWYYCTSTPAVDDLMAWYLRLTLSGMLSTSARVRTELIAHAVKSAAFTVIAVRDILTFSKALSGPEGSEQPRHSQPLAQGFR